MHQQTESFGSALERSPVVHVVDEAGRIRALPLSLSINHSQIDHEGQIRRSWLARGWIALKDAYLAENFERGWEVFQERERAVLAGQVAPPLPDRWLPKLVVARRRNAAEPTVWQPPDDPEPPKTTRARKAS